VFFAFSSRPSQPLSIERCDDRVSPPNTPRSTTPRRWPITACSRRSARRRRLRQRAGRELRRQLQDRADRRPRVALTLAARARRRRVHRLVQRRPPTPSAR
jgi:hypothetical protein